ncbi:MAG TPA: hypothetical protein VLW26_10530 [Steroidobacteraceae bacterium]|nr:hypothetical protein [Steroidobacteraceae bacterium]
MKRTGSLIALCVLAAAASGAALAADPAHVERNKLTGAWDRYPGSGGTTDPRYTAAPPAPPAPLKEPFKSEWEARQKAAHEADLKGQPLYSGYTQCLPDGMPAMMMAMFPLEVLQTPGQITIIEEAYNQVRRIYLGEKQIPIADAEPLFWGHSVGHWEGDTLVVNTVGVKENVRFRDVPHSDQMQIDERIRLLTPDLFQDEITITDPVYLTQPWSFKWMYKRMPGYKILEYVCESNREYRDPQTGGTRLRIGEPDKK